MITHLLPGRTPTILVVDDQEANIQAVGTLLGMAGCSVMPALSAEQALQRLAAKKPDLILLDMMMPGVSGLDLCRRLKAKEQYEAIPVIFLSAAGEVDLITAALEAGAVDYVTKPFHRAELLSRVRTHLELKIHADELHRIAADREELLALLAHDLKNRLAAVQMHAEFLSAGADALSAPQQQCAAVISTEIAAMTAAVRDMLANQSAPQQALYPEPVDAALLLQEMAQWILPLAVRKGQHVRSAAVPEGAALMADIRAVRQVLENLLSNAVKYSPHGSEVQLSAETDAEWLHIHVRDSGPGFTAEDQARLFTRYGRLSARPTGGESSTGLGLHIAHALARRMGGSVTLKPGSGPDGSTFTLTLPAVRPAS